MQTSTDDASRTSLALRAAETAKGQRQDRDSLVSTESTSDSVTPSIRNLFLYGSSNPSGSGDEITKVSTVLVACDSFFF